MSSYLVGMTDSTRRTGASRYFTWVSADTCAQAAQAASGAPNDAACNALVPDWATRHRASRRLGIMDAASLISARTGVIPRVPMMSALVINAPSQCEKSMTSGPATPGKKYLLPPENPTTSCGNTGPTTSDTSFSTTARFSTTSTDWSNRPSDSSATRSALIRPSELNVSGFHHSWLSTV